MVLHKTSQCNTSLHNSNSNLRILAAVSTNVLTKQAHYARMEEMGRDAYMARMGVI